MTACSTHRAGLKNTWLRVRGARLASCPTLVPAYTLAAMKWLVTTFLALLVLTALQPWLQRLGIGRLPGDLRFKHKGREFVLPFTSTVLLSLLLMLLARLF